MKYCRDCKHFPEAIEKYGHVYANNCGETGMCYKTSNEKAEAVFIVKGSKACANFEEKKE